jgi:AcrR family transcriptional regulator
MTGVRERARAATIAEILRLARDQMEAEGAAALSLRAIAREMGMVSSGIYRYFASRDELLTALIIDSYERLGTAVEAADVAVRKRSDFRGRWRMVAHRIREWAVGHPSEWALLFGTPVPGYAAPADTIGPASRYTQVLLALLTDIAAAGIHHTAHVPRSMRSDLARIRDLGVSAPDGTLAVGLAAWAAVMGAVSLELFGHLHNVVDEPGALLDVVVEQHALVLVPR